MAASCTYARVGKGIRMHSWTWVSSANGTVTGLGASDPISGLLRQVQFVPLSGYQPTSGYGVQLLGSTGFDWLLARGTVIPNSGNHALTVRFFKTNSYDCPILYGATLTPNVTGAGDSKSGIIRMWTVDPKWM